jgi:ceramide glucosyltransferase
LFSTLRFVVLLAALAPLVYYVLSLYCIVDYFARLRKPSSPNNSFLPPASILKPVRGVDHGAYDNFSSFCRLDYPQYQLLFAVTDPCDPVIPLLHKLQQDFPERDIHLVTGVERLGENDKVNNLIRLVKEAKYDLVVMSDSDVRVEADYLREVTAPFADPAVGTVTAFYRCVGGGTLASALDMLGMAVDSVPSALVAQKLEGKIQFAFGWTMATTKKHLAEIGGWEAMVNHHSDDFELGNRIARRGYRVELMRKPVWMVFPKERFADYLKHELRWSVGLRNVRPIAYLGIIFTHGLPWALFGSIVAARAGWTGIAAAYLAMYLLLRLSVAYAAGVWGLGEKAVRRRLWFVPLRDALSFLFWVAGFFTDTIEWRGLKYRVKNKLLVPVSQEAAEFQRSIRVSR